MNLKRYYTFLNNFISFSLYKVIDAIIPIILIPYLMRVVGSENYGIYAFAYSLVLYLTQLIVYGFMLSAVRLISLHRDDIKKRDEIYNNVLTTQLYITIAVTVLLIILTFSFDKFYTNYIVYLYFVPMIIGIFLTPTWFFLGMEKMRFIAIINVVSRGTFVLLTFLLITGKADFKFIALFQSIGYLISGIAAQIIVHKTFNIKFVIAKMDGVIAMLKDGLSPFFALIAPIIYTNSAVFLIGIFSTTQNVSYMQIGLKVSLAFCMLNTILTNVFYPLLNRKKHLFNKVKYVFMLLGLVFSLSMYFFSDFLIPLWIATDYAEIIETVKLLSPSPFLYSIISTFGINGLLVYKKDRLFMIVMAAGSIAGLISAFILIPKYFYIGGSISILISLAIQAILCIYYNSKIDKNLDLNEA